MNDEERLERERFVSQNKSHLFRATVRGERRTFRAAEHVNFGVGWMMAGDDYPKQPHIVADTEMEDIEVIVREPSQEGVE